MPLRYLMELPMQAIGFAVMVRAAQRRRFARRARRRPRRSSSRPWLAPARQPAPQLQPHFLFNALNTVSATMYSDRVPPTR
jgi:hypothetical protein